MCCKQAAAADFLSPTVTDCCFQSTTVADRLWICVKVMEISVQKKRGHPVVRFVYCMRIVHVHGFAEQFVMAVCRDTRWAKIYGVPLETQTGRKQSQRLKLP